ncbi:hypothetical protein [Cellulomonas sp. URHD0024]|uniref:hypothetical protein n=1 Tax=Cellulomonas sp. URHD0024 TaxID=1302620 RepID=UPI0012DC941D|nr:hypothetical protein [Cellulomonas sp. URHD0024]
MRFEAFLAQLPAMPSPLSPAAALADAFDVSPKAVEGYVYPTITSVDWPAGASVVLVEAAGAVGKSAAGLAIAEKLNWPLVRAERAQVGSYSLSGLIQDALGFTSTFISEVATGDAGVVIDSLDEAHFRAGTENFLAFLDNVWKVSGASVPDSTRKPSVVLLSRSDTAELVRLAFLDANVPVAHVRLDFFDRTGALEFLRAYMAQRSSETGRPEYNVPFASPGPFERLRDSRFRQIATVLLRTSDVEIVRDWDRVRDFLGYTPVLIAMAEALAVTNPSAENPHLAAQDQSNLLREIIENISRREQRKFSEHMQPKLQALLPANEDVEIVASSMYTSTEQCARLIGLVTGEELAMSLPAGLPNGVRVAYEEAVRTFLPDHPFVSSKRFASVVFGDYVTSVACRSLEIRAALSTSPERGIQRVGPFFARFLADGPGGIVAINEMLVEHVISSWNQEADLVRSSESEVTFWVTGAEATLACRRESQVAHNEPAELEFEVVDLSGAFQIRRPLKRATIVTDQGVILGDSGKHLMLGPQVIVLADEITIEAETLRVETDRGLTNGAALAAESITANYLSKIEAGPTDLRVFTAEPPPRLRSFQGTLQIHESAIPFQRYLDLRTILTAFRSSTKGGLSVIAAKLEGKIVKDNPHRLRILNHLMTGNLVSRQGGWFYLDLAALGQHGFGLRDLQSGEPGVSVLTFLHDCES